jgi:tellurite resistance protein TehA-like permease
MLIYFKSRWSTQYFSVATMTPIWIFPAYPLLIIGPHAGNLSARVRSPDSALDIIIGGFIIQGTGFLVALTIYSAFVYRLMTQKLPRESIRPGMFVSVGPSAFTVSGVVNMAANAKKAFPADFMGNGELAAQIVLVVGNWMSLWLWGQVHPLLYPVYLHRRFSQSDSLADSRYGSSSSLSGLTGPVFAADFRLP